MVAKCLYRNAIQVIGQISPDKYFCHALRYPGRVTLTTVDCSPSRNIKEIHNDAGSLWQNHIKIQAREM